LLHMAPIYFLSELKGISEIRRHCLRRSPGSFPASSAICKRACSKGSSFSPISSPEALFARMTDRRKRERSGWWEYFFNCPVSMTFPFMQTASARRLFWVSVPVLSEQITDTQPKLSTAFRSFMTACSFAIFWVPIAWTMVTMEPRASGMAATASATANIRASNTGSLRYRLIRKIAPQIPIIPKARWPENRSKLACKGVFFSTVRFIREAMVPIWVSIPVSVTTAVPLPPVIRAPEKTILL